MNEGYITQQEENFIKFMTLSYGMYQSSLKKSVSMFGE